MGSICLFSPLGSILPPPRSDRLSAGSKGRLARVTKIADDDHLKSRERAVALHQGGKLSEAAEMYEILLRAEPANPDLWGLLSIAQLWLGRDEEALASWRKCLSIEATVPLRLRNIANFVLAMQQKNKIKAQSMDFLEGLDIPDWP